MTIDVYSDTRQAGRCKGCDADLTFAEVVKSGKRMPFNGVPVALLTRHDEAHRLIETLDLNDNHWASCPNAGDFRR
jgi:hypothetical protein